MSASDKPVVWLAGEIKTPPLSSAARMEAGLLLRRLQRGEKLVMPASRPMPSIGRRCHELRIVDEDSVLRVIYRTDPDAIVVGGVFPKKTEKTPQAVIEACKRRFRLYDDVVGRKE